MEKLRNILRRMESCQNVRSLLRMIDNATTKEDETAILAEAVRLRIVKEGQVSI